MVARLGPELPLSRPNGIHLFAIKLQVLNHIATDAADYAYPTALPVDVAGSPFGFCHKIQCSITCASPNAKPMEFSAIENFTSDVLG